MKKLLLLSTILFAAFSCGTDKKYDPWHGMTPDQVKDSIQKSYLKMYEEGMGSVASIKLTVTDVQPVSERMMNEYYYHVSLRSMSKLQPSMNGLRDSLIITLIPKVDSIWKETKASDTILGDYFRFVKHLEAYSKFSKDTLFDSDTAFIRYDFKVKSLKLPF